MGTRNLTMVYVGGEYKVAQYGQWDGYPEGQGKTVLNFLLSLTKEKKEKFIDKVKAVRDLTDKEIEKIEKDKKWFEKYPELTRDMCAKILPLIAKKKRGMGLTRNTEFVADSLFCEWCYVVDFDENTFEVYKGFNKTPLDNRERFATFADQCKNEYCPVKLWMKFDLNSLPTLKEFLEMTKEKQEKENK